MADTAFLAFACVVMAITAFRPQWTVYVLTYGRPERARGRERGIAFMRICAGVALVGFAIVTAYRLMIGFGVTFSVSV